MTAAREEAPQWSYGPAERPYATAAPTYWRSGWRGVLPLPANRKASPPTGFTGHGAPYLSWPDLFSLMEGPEGAGNICLRLPAGVLGIDVDAYDGKPGAATLASLETAHGPLSATWTSTSRDDGTSGIRLFRVPEGVNWVGALPGIETVHAGHRYMLVAPSVHPEGRVYRWLTPDGRDATGVPRPDELPDLPLAWVAALARPYPRTDPADLDAGQVGGWLQQLRDGAQCRPVTAVLVRELTRLSARDGGARHDICRDASRALAAFGGEGHAGVREALGALRESFVRSVTDPAHPGTTRDVDSARAEWKDLLYGAVRLAAAANPTPAAGCDCVDDDDLYAMTGQARPAGPAGDGRAEPGPEQQHDIPLDDRTPSPDRFFDKTDGLLAIKLTCSVSELGPIASDYTGGLYHYTDGVWHADGERLVRRRVTELLGDRYRMSHASTVVDIFANRPPLFDDATQDTAFLNLPNGLLDWRTGQLHPHDPRVPSIIRLPVEWEPTAACPEIESWIGEVFPADARDFIEEVIGYCLYNDNPFHKAILLFGRGRNGKGTFLRLLQRLIGDRNVSSVTPQSLDENRFRAAELYGKLANLVGDVDPRIFKATEMFKQVTGGDRVTAERKYGQPFTFYCRALLVAAFNALPRSADTSEGFFSRWIVVPFIGYFPPGVANPSREDKMASAAELRGLLVLAMRGLARLMARGQFELPPSVLSETATFRRVADPVRAFLDDYVPTLLVEWVPRTDVYGAYAEWAGQNGYSAMGAAAFYERVEAAAHDLPTHTINARTRSGTRGYLFRALATSTNGQGAEGADHVPPGRARGGKGGGPAPSAPSTDGDDNVTSSCTLCGNSLWSAASKARGICERCRLAYDRTGEAL